MRFRVIISGLGLIFFGWRSLTPNKAYSLWICCFIGIWISIAPLLFWAPTAISYLNGTLIGALVIALTVLIPGMPNMIMLPCITLNLRGFKRSRFKSSNYSGNNTG